MKDIPKHKKITEDISLELIEPQHAEALMKLTDNNRNWLREWLPWVDFMRTTEDFLRYIENCKKQEAAGTDFGFCINYQGSVVGRAGVHDIDQRNHTGALGYWLSKDHAGKGIVTACCSWLLELSFDTLALHRVELKCATGNMKSAAVAERLGFKKEGILREAEWLNGKYIDLCLFSMLKQEWHAEQNVKQSSVKQDS